MGTPWDLDSKCGSLETWKALWGDGNIVIGNMSIYIDGGQHELYVTVHVVTVGTRVKGADVSWCV